MKIEKAAFKFVGGIANSKITVLAEAGLKLTASKRLLAMLRIAHFTHTLRGAHSLARSIYCTLAHGKVVYANDDNESKSGCFAKTDGPTNQLTNQLTNQPTNKRIDTVEESL